MNNLQICGRNGAIDLGSFLHLERELFTRPVNIGLVIGTYAAAPYVHLTLEARKRLFPAIPILIHDDGSHKEAELRKLCDEYNAEFETNTTRLPPCKGDLSAFVGGMLWARRNGIDLLVKMSRRFIPKCDWTQSLASLAMDSQYATYSSWTTTYNFGFRTEITGLAVEEWFELRLFDELVAIIASEGSPFVEALMHNLARRAAGFNCAKALEYDRRVGPRPPDRNGYAVWDFIGTDRCAKSPLYLWHDADSPADYAAQAQAWGLPYSEEDFWDPNQAGA